LNGWKCPVLNLNFSGKAEYSDWRVDNNRLENILSGLGKCKDVRENLTLIRTHSALISKDEITTLLIKHNLEKVTVTF